MKVAMIMLIGILQLIIYPLLVTSVPPANSISMKIVNNAGSAIEVFWIDTISGSRDLVRQTSKPLRNGTEAAINSYDTHQFVARFAKHIDGVEAFFTKGPSEESVVITYDEEGGVMSAKQLTKFHEIMELISIASVTCNEYSGNEEFSNCITGQVMHDIDRMMYTKQEMLKYRDIMAPQLRKYVCSDPKVNLTQKVHTESILVDSRRYIADLYLDTPEAKIWVVNNAITSRECAAITTGTTTSTTATTLLETDTDSVGTATVVGVSGDTNQPGVTKAFYSLDDEFLEEDNAWPVFSRTFTITNHIAKYMLGSANQDPFEVITLEEGAEELPQCSGTCDGSAYEAGKRVAAAVLYCEVPQAGGLLHFPKSDIILQPKFGSGVFFSFKNAETDHMDHGYTEHSVCPITQGSQKTIKVHMRLHTPPASAANVADAAQE